MEVYQTVAEHIVDAITHGNFTVGGVIEDTRKRYGDTVELVNIVLGMLVERGVIIVTPTGTDRHPEPLPVAWWSVSLPGPLPDIFKNGAGQGHNVRLP